MNEMFIFLASLPFKEHRFFFVFHFFLVLYFLNKERRATGRSFTCVTLPLKKKKVVKVVPMRN